MEFEISWTFYQLNYTFKELFRRAEALVQRLMYPSSFVGTWKLIPRRGTHLFRLVTSWFKKPDGKEWIWWVLVLDGTVKGTCLMLRLEDEGTMALELWDHEVLWGWGVLDALNSARKVPLLTGHPSQFILEKFIGEESRIHDMKLKGENMNINASFIPIWRLVDYFIALCNFLCNFATSYL